MLTSKQVAMLLDSEGTITSTVRGQPISLPLPCIIVDMTDATFPKAMHEQFGGGLYYRIPKKANHSPHWPWVVNGKACEEVLTYAFSELVIKKQQAEAVLLMISATMPGKSKKLTDKQLLLRWTLHEFIAKLNFRGVKVEQVNEVLEELEQAPSEL